MTGSMIRRIFAGAFLALVMTVTLAGAASAQSQPSGPTTTAQATTTTIKVSGTLGRTGTEMWIPLVVGGGVTAIALFTRSLARARHTS